MLYHGKNIKWCLKNSVLVKIRHYLSVTQLKKNYKNFVFFFEHEFSCLLSHFSLFEYILPKCLHAYPSEPTVGGRRSGLWNIPVFRAVASLFRGRGRQVF